MDSRVGSTGSICATIIGENSRLWQRVLRQLYNKPLEAVSNYVALRVEKGGEEVNDGK